jgi:hypothetical protein
MAKKNNVTQAISAKKVQKHPNQQMALQEWPVRKDTIARKVH